MRRALVRMLIVVVSAHVAVMCGILVMSLGGLAVLDFFGLDEGLSVVLGNILFALYVSAALVPSFVYFLCIGGVAVAEFCAWRSLAYFVVLGGAIALAALAANKRGAIFGFEKDGDATLLALSLIAGSAGGLAYWYMADRKAGIARGASGL